MVPEYKIHIASIKHLLHLKSTAYDHQHCAAILCSADFRQITRQIPFRYFIRLKFQDTNDPTDGNSFSSAQAKELTGFLSGLPAGITDLYIACDAGCSRSPAIAAALLRASHRSDMLIWKNPRYYPNPLVYKTLCDAYRLFTPEIMVHLFFSLRSLNVFISQLAWNCTPRINEPETPRPFQGRWQWTCPCRNTCTRRGGHPR